MRQSADGVYELADPNDTPVEVAPTVAFRIGADTFHVRRPKLAIALSLTAIIEDGGIRPGTSVGEVGQRLLDTLWQLVAYVTREEPVDGKVRGQQRLMQRLRDPDDRLDILDLAEPFSVICRAVFDRPTGPSPAPSAQPAGDGTDSVEASPAPQAATSGT